MSLLQEVEQEPFDADDFVERIAWRTTTNVSKGSIEDFDPDDLHAAFEKMISDLKGLNVSVDKRSEKLQMLVHEEEKKHWQRVRDLQKQVQTAHTHFQELDERINYVATKVVHLGDQLEGVNIPRARAVEAQKLMNFFSEFLSDEPLQSPVFTDYSQLHLAADIIQKLHLISQELPQSEKFDEAKSKIQRQYEEIERALITDFIKAHRDKDKRNMKRIALTLSHFKGYNRCIDEFVKECQLGQFMRSDVFVAIIPLCHEAYALINEVFINPETVMSRLVLSIYNDRINHHVMGKLANRTDSEKYLMNLYELYTRTQKISNDLSTFKMGNDSTFLTKLMKNIYSEYLASYMSVESRFLNEKCSTILSHYYDTKGHVKRQVQSGTIHDLRRDLAAKIGTKSIGPNIETYGGETFLSQEVAINLLQECKLAFKRGKALSSLSELATNATKIFGILVQYLCHEHIGYALELGIYAIPVPDATEPEIYLFDVVGQANTIFHLFEKLFTDCLIPLVISSPKHSEVLNKKREIMETMENNMDFGIDRDYCVVDLSFIVGSVDLIRIPELASRCKKNGTILEIELDWKYNRALNVMITWVRNVLSTEQKKTDFRPETDDCPMLMFSAPCGKVVRYVSLSVDKIRDSLDGKNVDNVLTEYGIRLHRVIYDHLMQFQYSSMGAMLAICDVNEYRKCVKEFNVPLVTSLFDTLHALCNLLVVVPDNLKKVCSGEQLAGLDKSVLQSFVSLRADYRTARLANHFK